MHKEKHSASAVFQECGYPLRYYKDVVTSEGQVQSQWFHSFWFYQWLSYTRSANFTYYLCQSLLATRLNTISVDQCYPTHADGSCSHMILLLTKVKYWLKSGNTTLSNDKVFLFISRTNEAVHKEAKAARYQWWMIHSLGDI